MDLKLHFQRIKAKETELASAHPSGCVWLSSVENEDSHMPGGKIFRCLPRLAAECLVNRTHVLAEPEAIAAWQKQDELSGRAIQARESQLAVVNKRPPKTSVQLTPEAV